MINNISKDGFRFIQNEGVNAFPTGAVLSSKLFLNSEGKDYDVTAKMAIGDDIGVYPTGLGISHIPSIRNEIITKGQLFKNDIESPYISYNKVIFQNNTYFVIKSDGLYKGENVDDVELYISTSILSSIINLLKIVILNNLTLCITNTGIHIINMTNPLTPIITSSIIPDGVLVNAVTYNSEHLVFSSDSGIFISSTINLTSFLANDTFTFKKILYKDWVEVSNEDPSSESLLTNGLNELNTYVGVVSYSDIEVLVLDGTKGYILNIETAYDFYDENVVLVTEALLPIEAYTSMWMNNKEYLCGANGVTEYPSQQIILSDNCNYIFIDGTKIIGISSTPTVLIKVGSETVKYTASNGIIGNSYTGCFTVIEDETVMIKLLYNGGVVSSYKRIESKVNLYSVAFNYKTDYKKQKQNVKKVKFGAYDLALALFDTSSSSYISLTTANNGVPAQFLIVRIERIAGGNTWYICGDDGRATIDFKDTAREFGIVV